MIMLQGWSRADRQNFKASMTGKPLPHPMGPVQYKPHYTKKSLIKHALNRLILLGFSGLVLTFALILILAVPVLRDVACPQETAKLPLFTLPAHTPGPTQSKPSNRPASSSTDIQIPPTVPTNSLSTPTLDIVLEPSTRSTTYGEVIDQLVTGLLGDTWPLYQRKASKSDRPSSTALVSAARIEHASTPCPSMFSLIATSLPKPSRPIPSQDMITYSTTTSLKALRGFCSCFIAWFRSVWAATAHYAASQNLFTIGDGSTSHSAPFLLQRTSL
ncbi:hypothetical protein B0H34DRAFT_700354 [Crassisporium funariophilum]|nr:hypothetical protein B0H34DRAFT_700354 [Crassisporium funariophilum]